MIQVFKPNSEDFFALLNERGDTIVPFEKYAKSFCKGFHHFGVMKKHDGKLVAINTKGQELFDVFQIYESPDPILDGLFRIVVDGKIGYANKYGKIVIKAQFSCADYFQQNRTKVSLACDKQTNGSPYEWNDTNYFYINKKGKKIKSK